MKLSSVPFTRLVVALKEAGKTLTTVEQSCGGIISSSILAQPGASQVFHGGTIAYSSQKAKPLLLNDDELHSKLTNNIPKELEQQQYASEAEQYIQSKLKWTAETSVAFCKAMDCDYVIAEGGATGPTFRPKDLTTGFSVIAVAGRINDNGEVAVLEQQVVRSTHNDREENMRFFADSAARLAYQVVTGTPLLDEEDDEKQGTISAPTNKLFLDRATHLRTDPDALAALRKEAKYVVLQNRNILVESKGDTALELALLSPSELEERFIDKEEDWHRQNSTFLGLLKSDNLQEGTPIFGIDITNHIQDTALQQTSQPYSFVETSSNLALMDQHNNELALHATALANWQKRTKFCNICGGDIQFVDGGTRCVCTQCKTSSYPRQDPSMIVVVSSHDGQRVLLARHQSRHPPKMHSVLAGFVEAGETFEAAVAREVWEETGVVIENPSNDITYFASQPWPFPCSTMIGFMAKADDDTATKPLKIQEEEIISAQWFTKEEVAKAAKVQGPTMQEEFAKKAIENDPSLSLLIPPEGVIARDLINKWLEEAYQHKG